MHTILVLESSKSFSEDRIISENASIASFSEAYVRNMLSKLET